MASLTMGSCLKRSFMTDRERCRLFWWQCAERFGRRGDVTRRRNGAGASIKIPLELLDAQGETRLSDFFGFNSSLELQYRGRLDASRTEKVPDAERELLEAMRQIARTGKGPEHQIASMGCSIKWRSAA